MKRFIPLFAALALAALAVSGTACTTYQPLRDTTQPGKIRKSAFIDGKAWYMATTVVDAPYEAAFTFPGEQSNLWKIKWRVEEKFLYAYRTHEFIVDSEFAGAQDEFEGEPVAAYRIDHLDVWKQYNAVTGEEMPILFESRERPWWEREWIRVDWSKNMIGAFDFMFKDLCQWSGQVVSDPVSYFPTRDGDPEQFFVASRNGDGSWTEHYGWEAIEAQESFDYMDVVQREFVHYNTYKAFTGVDIGCWPYPVWPLEGGMQVTERVSFMKVPEGDYQVRHYPDETWERFALWRVERDVYDPDRGITDAKIFNIARWNIWERSTNDQGQVIPPAQRKIKPIVYYYVPTERLPSQQACAKNGQACQTYVHDGLYTELADQWNQVFRGVLKAVNHPEAATAQVFQTKPIEYTCGPSGDRACQRLGDMRYSFMYNHDTVFSRSPLGYGPSFQDPETGEIIAATANMYGGALRTYAGILGDYYDLLKGNVSELEIATGENIREYLNAVGGTVMPPRFPIVNFEGMQQHIDSVRSGAFDPTNPSTLSFPELQLRDKLVEFKQSMPRDADRRSIVAGSPIERQLIPAEFLAMAGLDPAQPLTDDVLDQVSPFRGTSSWNNFLKASRFFAERNVLRGEEMWQDLDVGAAVARAEAALGGSATKQQVIDYLLQRLFVGIEAHEIGHTVGLYHNFEGSFDAENYHPEYYEILEQFPDIELGTIVDGQIVSTWDTDSDGVLSGEEYAAYQVAWEARKREQEAAGIDLWNTSAVMDYNGTSLLSSELAGVGRYEHAALKYGYGESLEIYSNDQALFSAAEITAAGGWDSFVFQKRNRIDVPYYAGGQSCTASAQCPGANHPVAPQQCRANLGRGNPLSNGTATDLGACSDIYYELGSLKRRGRVDYPEYMSCTDMRRGDKPFCSVWDEGKSAQEVVQKHIDQYERNYIFSNFRRYRANFEPFFYFNGVWGRFQKLGKIYQSLLFGYYYRPGFTENIGPGGMLDTFLAARNSVNFFAKVVSTPDVGSYLKWDPNDTYYDGAYTESHAGWADVYVPLGLGKHLYTAYEQGELGTLYRPARVGSYYDKLAAIMALTTRDWGQPSANDETFPLNFYDGFQDEMLDLFRGIVTDDMKSYAPLIRGVDADGVMTSLEYRDHWQGGFLGTKTADFRGLEAVAGYDTPLDYSGEVIDAGGSIFVRMYALIYALVDFPVFFDANFPSYVQLYTFGKPSARDVDAITNDPTVASFLSPDREMLYVVPQTEGERSLFHPLVVEASQIATKVETWRAFNGVPPVGFSDDPNHQACYKVLGLNGADPQADRDLECFNFLLGQEESRLNSVESFLRTSVDFLNQAGYPTR